MMGQLDNTRMGKLARDCGIVGTYAKNLGEVDVVFAKVSGGSTSLQAAVQTLHPLGCYNQSQSHPEPFLERAWCCSLAVPVFVY